MAHCYKTQAIVFAKKDFGEADRVFNALTYDYGRIEIFGKAIRKINSKLKSGIDIFCFSEIEFVNGKIKKTLTDAVLIKNFPNVIYDLEKFEIATKIASTLEVLVRGQEKDKKLFKLFEDSLEKLNDKKIKNKKNIFLFYYFLWNALSVLGHKTEINKCAGCSEKLIPYNIFFSIKEGGVICKKCFLKDKDAIKINSDVVKIIRIINANDWEILLKLKIEKNTQELLLKISKKLINYYE